MTAALFLFAPGCKKPSPAGVKITAIEASSTLENKPKYGAKNLLDGDQTTCWAEGKADSGTGETVTITFEKEVRMEHFYIINGLGRNGYYRENNRVKELSINGEKVTVPDAGIGVKAKIDLEKPVTAKVFTFRIEAVYQGTKWNDTCISEILFGEVADGAITDDSTSSVPLEYDMTTPVRYSIVSYDSFMGRTVRDSKGNFYISGWNSGEGDFIILKTDLGADFIWKKRFGTDANDLFGPMCIDSKDNLYGGGTTYINSGGPYSSNADIYAFRADTEGNTAWVKVFDIGYSDERVTAAVTDSRGYLFMGGCAGSSDAKDAFIMAVTPEGEQAWLDFAVRGQSGSKQDIWLTSMVYYSGGIGASVYVPPVYAQASNAWSYTEIVRYTPEGKKIVSTPLKGEGDLRIDDIACDSDGTIYGIGSVSWQKEIPGDSRESGDVYYESSYKNFLCSINSHGKVLWKKELSQPYYRFLSKGLGLQNGRLVAVGFETTGDINILEFSTEGELLGEWRASMPDKPQTNINSVFFGNNGEIYLTGQPKGEVYIIRLTRR